MAEEVQATPEKVDEKRDSTDWKAKYEAMREHSREWERKAKGNQDAADELEKLKAAQMDESEKAVKRAEKAEAELNALKAQAARAEAVSAVADANGVPTEFVAMLSGNDAEELAAQVKRALELLPAYPARTDDGGTKAVAKKSMADRFAENLGL